jgi:DNA-binding Lrp family transcriptional regulator
MTFRIDATDERILYHLATDARHTSAPDIAAELDVSPPTVRNRIRRLEEQQVIQGYHAHIDYERVGGRLTNLFTCSTTGTDRERFAHRILAIPGVINVKEVMTGREDLHVVAVCRDTDDISRIARDIKATGVEIEDEDLIHRQHFAAYHPFGPAGEKAGAQITTVADLAGNADVVEITVGDEAPVAGKTIQEASEDGLIESGVLVITIMRDEEAITPDGETEIETGDRITVLSRGGLSEGSLNQFTGDS